MEKLEKNREFHLIGNPYSIPIVDKRYGEEPGIKLLCVAQFKDTEEMFCLVFFHYYCNEIDGGFIKIGNGNVEFDEYSSEKRGRAGDTYYFFDGKKIVSTREVRTFTKDQRNNLKVIISKWGYPENESWFDQFTKYLVSPIV